MTHRHSLEASVACALGLILAACGGTAGTASPGGSPAAAASSPASAPASKPSAAPIASASASSAAAGTTTTLKVGVVQSLTGPLAVNAKDNTDAFNMYLASVGDTVNGIKVDPVVVDDNNQTDQTLLKAKQLVESDKVQLLMGINNTPGCYAVAQYVKTAHVPVAVTGNCGAEEATTGAAYASPYMNRFTQNTTGIVDPAGDWAYRQGYRKVIVMTSDYGGGLEVADAFASVFVSHGGTVVQELHPPLGTPDFGPYVAQLTQGADLLAVFLPGIDSLRFAQQYANYSGSKKPQVLDIFGQMSEGQNLAQEGKSALGFIGNFAYTPAVANAANGQFVKAWQAKYPGRPISGDAGQGYSGAQVLVAALKQVDSSGNFTQSLLNALGKIDVETVKGPLKLDSSHDIIQNNYFFKVVQQGDAITNQIVTTYPAVARNWDRTAEQISSFKLGSHKGQWVGMTKEKLGDVVGSPQTSPSPAASASASS